MANLQHLESAARRKQNAPENWFAFQFEVVGESDYLIAGAICTDFYSRGPRKGKPKWPGGPGVKVVLTKADVDAEIARYVRETGNCPDCFGTKEEFASWNHETGTKMRPCERCGATGKAQL